MSVNAMLVEQEEKRKKGNLMGFPRLKQCSGEGIASPPPVSMLSCLPWQYITMSKQPAIHLNHSSDWSSCVSSADTVAQKRV